MMKLYIVVEKSLSAGLKIAQAVHAAILFEKSHPKLQHTWYTESNNIVVLEVDGVPSLADQIEKLGYQISRFTEPDLDDQLTAFCAEPAAAKHLSTLKLATCECGELHSKAA